MIPGFENHWTGDSPHYEVWYGKVDIAPERALWYRYTIFDGAVREASTWAVMFDGDDVDGGRDDHDLDRLVRPNTVVVPDREDADRFRGAEQVFHLEAADDADRGNEQAGESHLDESNAYGRAGPVAWDLQWQDSGRRFEYLPGPLEPGRIISSAYDACMMDLRVDGEVTCGDRSWEFEGRPGMVGHIHGTKISGREWAWAHCNNFDDRDDAAFEGLSVHLDVMGFATPALSAFVLDVEDRRWVFRSPISVWRADSSFGRDQWEFEVESGGATLEGRARAPDRDRVALVEYDDTDRSKLWCYNSKLADLTLRLRDPGAGVDETLRATGGSAFEYVTRDRPDETPLV